MNLPFRFGTAVKVSIFLFFYILAICLMGYISHDDLVTTEKKLEVLEFSYQIQNGILESRRLEKNYFLYGNDDFLHENLQIVNTTMDICRKLTAGDKNLLVSAKLKDLEAHLAAYGERISRLFSSLNSAERDALVADIRQSGKRISDISEQVVFFEKNQIHLMIGQLRQQLISWSSIAILIGIMLAIIMVYLVFKPLSLIKQAAEAIARGRFVKVDVLNTRDEIQQVMEAFNIMVSELERRQDQLIQAEKLSSLGTLTAGVAHQLNNPLNNISTSCQIAIDEFTSGDEKIQQQMLHNIEQETLRARDVVKNLLEFARTQEFAPQQAALAEVVHKSILLAKSQIRPDIGMTVDIPADLVLPMDVQRMQEVFINLIINATQAIDRQGQITIRAALDVATDEVVIEIQDNGQGIPEKNLARIFDPFFTTKEVGVGTGLGLSVVYGIVQQHRGSIAVQSKAGQGTSFFIRLPGAGSPTP
ncbi:HAMP domain-containing sensor histidine kinase [uncultured Desulfobulbus sp.]|uniref:sensor histidine kinase n=1 Tax=uncultured Desulfobulbus sp. TaxID=239745 RepID=UPI0026362B42|nr:HAMP domain-containing sensor histidine kinase [uncultured Desulfobulbus sp.]